MNDISNEKVAMDRNEISKLVKQRADQKGSKDKQMLSHLARKFSRQAPDEVFWGLYQVFLADEGDNFHRQQLAGQLFLKVNPTASFELAAVIEDCLETYNLSIEELPIFLCNLYGFENFMKSIEKIDIQKLNPNQKQALETFKYWVSAYDKQ